MTQDEYDQLVEEYGSESAVPLATGALLAPQDDGEKNDS